MVRPFDNSRPRDSSLSHRYRFRGRASLPRRLVMAGRSFFRWPDDGVQRSARAWRTGTCGADRRRPLYARMVCLGACFQPLTDARPRATVPDLRPSTLAGFRRRVPAMAAAFTHFTANHTRLLWRLFARCHQWFRDTSQLLGTALRTMTDAPNEQCSNQLSASLLLLPRKRALLRRCAQGVEAHENIKVNSSFEGH